MKVSSVSACHKSTCIDTLHLCCTSFYMPHAILGTEIFPPSVFFFFILPISSFVRHLRRFGMGGTTGSIGGTEGLSDVCERKEKVLHKVLLHQSCLFVRGKACLLNDEINFNIYLLYEKLSYAYACCQRLLLRSMRF